HPGRSLFFRWATEDIHAKVVAHEAGQQFALGVAPVFGMFRRVVRRGLERGPGRGPERIDPRRFMKQLGDVTTLSQNRQAERFVFYLEGLAISIGHNKKQWTRAKLRTGPGSS